MNRRSFFKRMFVGVAAIMGLSFIAKETIANPAEFVWGKKKLGQKVYLQCPSHGHKPGDRVYTITLVSDLGENLEPTPSVMFFVYKGDGLFEHIK